MLRVFLPAIWPALAAMPAFGAPCDSPDNLTRVTGKQECLIIRTHEHKGGSEPRRLFVLLHGNHTSGSPATSQFKVAEELAGKGPPGTVAVALIRPGYNDAEGNRSSGSDGGRGDNFTAGNVDIVADAILTLKVFHKASRVVLVGHSGGAAIAGVILGRHPGIAEAAVLVSCPCDVQAWRAMLGRGRTPWSSESPIRYVDRIPAQARVAVLVGRNDDVTFPALSKTYADALRERGIPVSLSIPDGIDHVNVIESPQVILEALRLGADN